MSDLGPTGSGWRPPAGAAPPSPSAPDPDPRPAPPQVDDLRRSGRATVAGEARSVQQRTESMGEQSRSIWTFRLERYDQHGNRLAPVQVEMRGLAFEGSLTDGDSVSVTGRWRGGALRANEVQNLTTGALVRAKSYKGLMIIALVVFLLFAGTLVVFAINSSNEFNEQQEQFERQREELFDQQQQLQGEAPAGFCEAAEAAGLQPAECAD